MKMAENELLNIVFNCLCRVLKDRKLYTKFRCFIGYGDKTFTSLIYPSIGAMRQYTHMAYCSAKHNPFYMAKNRNDIFMIFSTMHNCDISKEAPEEVKSIQLRISQFINTLLHCSIEVVFQDMHLMEEIGQEIFNMSCKKIFGEDFVDETENEIPEEIKKMIDKKRMTRSSFIEFTGKAFEEIMKNRSLNINTWYEDEDIFF